MDKLTKETTLDDFFPDSSVSRLYQCEICHEWCSQKAGEPAPVELSEVRVNLCVCPDCASVPGAVEEARSRMDDPKFWWDGARKDHGALIIR